MSKPVPKRFLFSCAGGYGHLHPLVALAQVLKQAGHTVAFAVGPSWKPLLDAAGLELLPLSINMQEDTEYQQFKTELAQLPLNLESEKLVYTRLFCGIGTRLRVPGLLEIAKSWQPDLLVREAGEYAAIIVAELLGIPHATVAFATSLKGMAVFEEVAAGQLDPIRRQWGLEADPGLAALYHYLCLSYAPPALSLQDINVPGSTSGIAPTTHFVRPNLFDQAGPEKLPEWMDKLPAQPTVYVTLGTEINKEPELYPSVLQTIIAGLRDSEINLIVTLGRDKDPADFGPQPPNVHIERYIPQSLLLKRCDLMVMHGGSNSLLAALEVGLPIVIVPLIADQFFNAEVVQNLGIGQVVQRDQLTPANIATAAREVLTNPLYRQNMVRLQAEMQALPDLGQAVKLLEQIVDTGQPVLNPDLVAKES